VGVNFSRNFLVFYFAQSCNIIQKLEKVTFSSSKGLLVFVRYLCIWYLCTSHCRKTLLNFWSLGVKLKKIFYFSKKLQHSVIRVWSFFTEIVAHRLFQLEIICFQPFLLLKESSLIFIVGCSTTNTKQSQ